MKPETIRDGGRERCSGCGHPRKEHRDSDRCSVPKCRCVGYALKGVAMAAARTDAVVRATE
jgi:hypothetical protein